MENGQFKNLKHMIKTIKSTRESVKTNCYCKSNDNDSKKKIFEPIYKDLANPQAVKVEISEVIKVFNEIIKTAKRQVDGRKSENIIKYSQRAFYSQDLNATIKEHIIKKINADIVFNSKVRIRKNAGSTYFIIKDKYILYVKRLYGKQNKPNCFPTLNSAKLLNGTLFPGLDNHIPVLFIGPNLSNIDETDAFVTSLISKNEVNWSSVCSDLFTEVEVKQLVIKSAEEIEKVVVKLKDSLKKSVEKQINN